jgi:hypothetical protein
MCTAGPATGPALTLFQFLLGSTNPPLARYVLFGIINPADELIASERSDVIPRIECWSVGHERTAQIWREFMHYATRYSLSAHGTRLTAASRLR